MFGYSLTSGFSTWICICTVVFLTVTKFPKNWRLTNNDETMITGSRYNYIWYTQQREVNKFSKVLVPP